MKILWSFDPFGQNKDLHVFGKNILTNLFGAKDSIEAVYVASNSEAELATAFHIPASKRYSSYPKGLMKEEIKGMNLKKVKSEVLVEKSLSLTSVVKNIVEYSKKKNIDLILIATNTKKILPKMVLGSFAETLVHMSVCDLLIYHQKTKFQMRTPKNLLYAHDFSSKGSIGLERAIVYAKKWNATLTIVYIPVPEVGMELHTFKDSVQKRVQKIEKALENQKVKGKVHLEYDVKPITETILNVASKTNADLIAVAAQSSKLAALIGGSITRQILRESSLPTLVLKV